LGGNQASGFVSKFALWMKGAHRARRPPATREGVSHQRHPHRLSMTASKRLPRGRRRKGITPSRHIKGGELQEEKKKNAQKPIQLLLSCHGPKEKRDQKKKGVLASLQTCMRHVKRKVKRQWKKERWDLIKTSNPEGEREKKENLRPVVFCVGKKNTREQKKNN